MLGRAFLLTSILLMGAFAGCISKDDAPVDTTPEENETPTGFASEEDVKAPDGRGEISAFQETNRTETNGTGAMQHLHDYWHGETRKLVDHIYVPLIPFPLLPCKESGTCTAGGSAETYPAGTAIADFDIAKPGLVYEGSTALELFPNYINFGPLEGTPASSPHPNAHIFFDYLTASDEPGAWRVGGELVAGTPFTIPVAPTEADMPHQTKSLWLFRFYSDSTTLWFEMNVTLTAVKGGEVVNWPPHPDLYAERSERTIFDEQVHLESKGTIDSFLFGSDAGWVNPPRIISWGTDRVEVTVTDVRATTNPPGVAPSGWVLEYHNASKPPLLGNGAQYGGRLVDEGSDGTTYHFVIDITGDLDSYDTPYGEKSRWGFRLVPQFDNGGAVCVDNGFVQQFLVGCQFVPWQADYKMTIKAYGRPHTSELPDPNAEA